MNLKILIKQIYILNNENCNALFEAYLTLSRRMRFTYTLRLWCSESFIVNYHLYSIIYFTLFIHIISVINYFINYFFSALTEFNGMCLTKNTSYLDDIMLFLKVHIAKMSRLIYLLQCCLMKFVKGKNTFLIHVKWQNCYKSIDRSHENICFIVN